MTRSNEKTQPISACRAAPPARGADTGGRPADPPANRLGPDDEDELREPSVDELLRCIETADEVLSVAEFDALQALEAIAPDVLEELLAAFAANRGNVLVRRRLAELLAYADVRDDRIRAALLESLAEDPVAGAGWLAAYGDRTVIAALLRAFDATELGHPDTPSARTFEESGEPHEDAYAIASAVKSLGGALSAAQRAKLEEVMRRRDAVFTAFMAATPPPPMPPLGERQSRNSHCRCGSGRKYKKCHLAADVAGMRKQVS